MAIDMRRPLGAALRAALDETLPQQPKAAASPQKGSHQFGAGRALLLGAGLVTAGRLVTGSRGRALLEQLTQGGDHAASSDDDRFEDEEDFDDEEFDDEPAAEGEEDLDDEDAEDEDDEEDFDDEEFDDEPEAEGEDDVDDSAAEDDEADDDVADDEAGDEDDEDDEADERPRRRSSGSAARSRPKAGGRSRR